jgi:LysR family transcriptional regulator, benzoate and cis,cis-muconate-responsive activator of ben and cat genes
MLFRYACFVELRHLRYFVVVAEEQNVTRAAERLHVSQPPLSRQIHDLEQELGVELFRRTAKSLALTEAGKIFLIEARAVLLRVDKAVETVRTVAHGDRGSLRIGYAPSLTAEFLPRALRLFEAAQPGVRVALHDLSSEECVQRLAAGKLDLALTVPAAGARTRGLRFERLIAYPICCAVGASHPLARKRSLTLDEIRREKFIIYTREDYPEYYDWLASFFRDKPFSPCQVEEYDGATGLIAAVEAGRGIAIVTTSMRCMAGPRLRLIPLRPVPGQAIVGALTAGTLSPLVEKFMSALKQAVKG